MKQKTINKIAAAGDEPLRQLRIAPDILDAQRAEAPRMDPGSPSARTQEHMRRLAAGELCEADPRRTAKTEYVMRLLVNGRAPLEEPPASAAPEPPPAPAAVPPPPPPPKYRAQPKPEPGVMTLENLTFDDLLAELENL